MCDVDRVCTRKQAVRTDAPGRSLPLALQLEVPVVDLRVPPLPRCQPVVGAHLTCWSGSSARWRPPNGHIHPRLLGCGWVTPEDVLWPGSVSLGEQQVTLPSMAGITRPQRWCRDSFLAGWFSGMRGPLWQQGRVSVRLEDTTVVTMRFHLAG